MKKDNLKALTECPLLTGCDPQAIYEEMKRAGAYEEAFSQKDLIPCRKENEARVGICLGGRAGVYSIGKESTLLNRLRPGSVFGVASLYADEDADTRVIAETDTLFLFLERESLEVLLENKRIRENLIRFLSGRIRFLTEKISSFTAPLSDGKLRRYLEQNADETGLVSTFRSYAELARATNLGRASLYRAMQSLEEEGVIRKDGKKIWMISKEKQK